jgi:TonB-linked SusC/RagA family outer membrane protein
MKKNLRFAARCAALLLLIMNSVLAQAQERRVTGKVTTSSDGQGLPGVNVQVQGTNVGTVTDAEGQFTIAVPGNNSVLVISSIGFMKKEIAVGNQSTINVSLSDDVKSLSEVVVTGYGTQNKRDITGSVATVDTKQLLSVPSTNLAQAMQGRVAGVNVSNDNSPGGGVMVRIRGFGTINDNSPLYVIDGTPTKENLNTLNLNDIESMQVLKDASAASIYGSRAANGVVIITTKKGKAGKPVFTYDAYYGQQKAWRFLDLLNTQQYADLLWESRINGQNTNKLVDGAYPAGTTLSYPDITAFGKGATPVIPFYVNPAGKKQNEVDESTYNFGTRNLITRANQQGTDWFDAIFEAAPIQNHQIGVSGATEAARYAMSANIFDQQGIMKFTYFKRYSLRANTEFNVTKKFRVGENLQVAYGERVGQTGGNQSESNPISFAYRIPPIIPRFDVNGYYAGAFGSGLDNSRNPEAEVWRNKDNKAKELRLFGNAYAEWDILPNLTAKTQFGVDYNTYNLNNYRANDPESPEMIGTNTLRADNNYGFTWTWYNTLNYTKTFGDKHRANLMVGTESIRSYFEFVFGERSGFAVDELANRYLNAGRTIVGNGGGGREWTLASEFARANYAFDDRYLIDFTLRRDRSSRFAPAFRTAYFPSVSAGWVLSEESFLKGSSSWLNFAKLRIGYGQTGNQEIGNYNAFSTYLSNPETSFYDLAGSNTSALQGYELGQFGNANAKWETTTSTNVGLDATFLGGKLEANLDWYSRITSDMLFPVEVQYTQGRATNPFQNIGEMSNKGVELALNFGDKKGDFSYSLGGNLATYRNKVIKTTGDPNVQYFGFTTRLAAAAVTQQGFPIASFYGYTIDGIFQSDAEGKAHAGQFVANTDAAKAGNPFNKAGAFKFRDTNNDGVINASDRGIIGSPHPDFTYGINASVGYKNFTLDVFGQGVSGNQIFNYVRYWTDFPTFGGNRSIRMFEDSWRPGKTDAKLPIPRSNDVISSLPSTYYLEDGSYFRLKNIQLGYTLPKTLTDKVRLGSARVYVQGQNWLTFTKYTGLDPELNLRNSSGSGQDIHMGFDEGAYPAARTTLVGLNLTF